MVEMSPKAMAQAVLWTLSSSFSMTMWRRVLAMLGEINGCRPALERWMQRGGSLGTSCMDRVGDEGTYWTDDS
jgi:hypothetical protein